MFFPWNAVALLGFESSSVISKRLAKISLGNWESVEEVGLMFVEKCDAAIEASVSLMFGGTMQGAVDQLRVLVAANEARLST